MTSRLLMNMTPFHIFVYPEDGGPMIMYPRSGILARLSAKKQQQLARLEDGTPVFEPQQFVDVVPQNPPPLDPDVKGVIVSMPVGEFLRKKKGTAHWISDSIGIYCADTGPDGAIRDESGTIVGTKRLVRYV